MGQQQDVPILKVSNADVIWWTMKLALCSKKYLSRQQISVTDILVRWRLKSNAKYQILSWTWSRHNKHRILASSATFSSSPPGVWLHQKISRVHAFPQGSISPLVNTSITKRTVTSRSNKKFPFVAVMTLFVWIKNPPNLSCLLWHYLTLWKVLHNIACKQSSSVCLFLSLCCNQARSETFLRVNPLCFKVQG